MCFRYLIFPIRIRGGKSWGRHPLSTRTPWST